MLSIYPQNSKKGVYLTYNGKTINVYIDGELAEPSPAISKQQIRPALENWLEMIKHQPEDMEQLVQHVEHMYTTLL